MNSKEKSILIEFFGKTLNLTAEDVAPIFEKKGDDEELKSDALTVLLKHDATRVKTFKDEVATAEKAAFDKGHKKAASEILPKLEKSIREKFDFDSEKQGLDLIEEIISSKTKVPEMEDDKVKIHPAYTKLEKESAKRQKDIEAEWTKKLEDKEKEIARKEVLGTVKKSTIAELSKLNPVFGTKDDQKINNQIDQLLMKDLEQYDYLDQNGQMIVMKEGKRLEDEHGKPVTFESLVKAKASKHWDFAEGQNRAGAGASNDDAAAAAAAAAAGKKYKGPIPKTEEEFNKIFPTLKDSDERIELTELFEQSQKA
jgi:hypothetical protein